MKLITQTQVLEKNFGIEKTIEIAAAAGFDGLDLSCFDMLKDDSPKLSEDYLDYAKKLKFLAEEKGLFFAQAHAPFPSSNQDEVFTETVFKKIIQSMKIAATLGVQNIVVHPKQHLKYADNAEYLKELNIEFYKSLIPYCEEYNIHVAMENMWQYNDQKIITHSTCSKLAEFKEYLDRVDSEWIVGCLDIGHVNLMDDRDIPAFIKGLMPKLKCFHIHSTGYNKDMHQLPYVGGDAPWEDVLKAIAESGYEGDFTYEADEFLSNFPKECMPYASRLMADVGKEMIRKIEGYNL